MNWYTRHHAEDGIYWKQHPTEEACRQHAYGMFAPSIRREGDLYTDTNYGRRMWVVGGTEAEYKAAVAEDKASYAEGQVTEELL